VVNVTFAGICTATGAGLLVGCQGRIGQWISGKVRVHEGVPR